MAPWLLAAAAIAGWALLHRADADWARRARAGGWPTPLAGTLLAAAAAWGLAAERLLRGDPVGARAALLLWALLWAGWLTLFLTRPRR